MNRRKALVGLVSLGGAFAVAPAQSQPKPRHIGVLVAVRRADAESQSRVAAFEDGLAKLGWKKGANLLIDYRFTDGDPSRLAPQAKELLGSNPEVAVAFTESSASALRQLTLSVPIVFVQVPDPVAAGFVTNLARPEGNITGFTNFDAAIGTKWLQIIKEFAPKVNRIAIVFGPTNPSWRAYVRSIEAAAKTTGIELSPLAVTGPAEIETEVGRFASAPNGALLVLPGTVTVTHRAVITSVALRHRLPAIYPYRYHAVGGGLMSYGVDLDSLYRGGASYVDRILKGAKPADLPIQQPRRFEFVINLKTAKAMGMSVPHSLLQQADTIIQ